MAKEKVEDVVGGPASSPGATVGTDQPSEIKWRDDFKELEAQMAPHFVADKSGTITLAEGKTIFDFAPADEGVSLQSYEKNRRFVDLATNVTLKIGAEKGAELMKKDKNLSQASIHAPVWKKDVIEGTIKREGTSRNVRTGEVSTYKGSMAVGRLNVVSTRTQAEMQNIKQHLRNLADAAGL